MKYLLFIVLLLTLLVFVRLLIVARRRKPDLALSAKSSIADEWTESYDTPSPSPGRIEPEGRLAGKVAIITGAGSGIGRACAIAFAREGARVVLVGRRQEPLNNVAATIGANALAISADISKKNDIERIVAETVRRFGRLDVLVNNAAALVAGTAETHTEAEWDETYDTNVKGLWLLS